jgi:hypothetical protein
MREREEREDEREEDEREDERAERGSFIHVSHCRIYVLVILAMKAKISS